MARHISSLSTVRYDINAQGDPAASPQELLGMIQTMLKERFGLRWHNETKTGSVYELIRAKVGPQLHETSAPGRGIAPGPGKLTAFGSPMSLLAKVLSD